MKTFDVSPGDHISSACEEAVELAAKINEPVRFDFNGTEVIVNPGEPAEAVEKRWQADSHAAHEAYLNSSEYRQAKAEAKVELRRKMAATMVESAQTEPEMRSAEAPWPYTMRQLSEYIDSLTDRTHDYGTCVYAMSLAAVAAFNYVSHKLGSSGFQSSCADLDILRRTRLMKGPFLVLKAEDALYPQYDLPQQLAEALEEWRPWLAEQARQKLNQAPNAHPAVLAYWKRLVED